MRKPEESLDDFTVKAAEKAAPMRVSLRFTGEVRVLEPLVPRLEPRAEILVADPDPATASPFLHPAGHRLSWFQSSLAAAGVMVLVLLSGLFVANLDPIEGPVVDSIVMGTADAIAQVREFGLARAQEPLDLEALIAESSPPAAIELLPLSSFRTTRHASRARRGVYRPLRHSRPAQPTIAAFVPTKLVIYAENGEIKTRIEPQFVSVYINH